MKSAHFLERSIQNMPLGVADSYRYWGPNETIFVDTLTDGGFSDVNGKEFIDFRLAYGPIILGYRDQRVDEAVIQWIRSKGTMSGFSMELDSIVAEKVKSMCPNIQKLRFANSGTEAVMGAVRTARGFTGRQKIVIIEGGFHGLYDEMMWKSDVENWDPQSGLTPEVMSFGSGVTTTSRELIDLIPLNSEQALQDIFAEQGEQIAAVVIEPILGNCGSIQATPEYVKQLRDICDQYGSLLIFDEVKTGFRVAKGGVQELYGIQADLTTYAKAMGNGYPIAAFGGRSDIMDRISFAKDGVVHGGTYTANGVGLAAASTTLDIIAHTEALETVAQNGKTMMSLLTRVFAKHSIPLSFSGPPSMFGVHLSESVPTNYRDWKLTDSDLYTRFAKNLIQFGIMLEPDSREPWFLCEAHSKIDFSKIEDLADKALAMAKEMKSDL